MGKTMLAVVLVGMVCGLHAQDAAQSTVDLSRKANGSEPSAAQTPVPEQPNEPQLPSPTASHSPDLSDARINGPVDTKTPAADVPELSQLDEAFKQTSLGKAADDFRNRVEWRNLKNDAASDPEVRAARQRADVAKTDLEKRELLKDYYEIYYAKMRVRASSPEMRKALEEFKADHLRLLAQPRVRPDSDLPNETPTPAPKSKKKMKKIPGVQ